MMVLYPYGRSRSALAVLRRIKMGIQIKACGLGLLDIFTPPEIVHAKLTAARKHNDKMRGSTILLQLTVFGVGATDFTF